MATNKGSRGVWILAAVIAWFGLRALPDSSASAEPLAATTTVSASEASKPPPTVKNECAEKNCDVECSSGLDETLTGFTTLYGVTPRAMIALGADPVDSGLSYYFDATLEGLEAAAGDVHDGEAWVRDRFFLPWKNLDNEGKPRSDLYACRKSVPGLILYRRKRGQKSEGLAVFLVGETSTWGIEEPIFADAVRRVSALRPPEPNQPTTIAILGPTFSGTANSLSAALQLELDAARKQGKSLNFKLRSGTATAS